MPKFRPPKAQVQHLEAIKCSWKFSTFPANVEAPILCEIVDSEDKKVVGAEGQAAEHYAAFNIAFEKVKTMGPPKTAGELAAENAALRAMLAAKGAEPATSTDAPKRGRGRPPGSPNRPRNDEPNDEGAGPNTEQGDMPAA